MATFTSTTSLNSHRGEYAPIGVLELSKNNNSNNPNSSTFSAASSSSTTAPAAFPTSASSAVAQLRSASSKIPGRAIVVALAVVLLFVASFGLTPRIAAGKVPPIGFPATHPAVSVEHIPVPPPATRVIVRHNFKGDITQSALLPGQRLWPVQSPVVRSCVSPTTNRVSSCVCSAAHPAVVVKSTAIIHESTACSCAFDLTMHNSKALYGAHDMPLQWSMQLVCAAV